MSDSVGITEEGKAHSTVETQSMLWVEVTGLISFTPTARKAKVRSTVHTAVKAPRNATIENKNSTAQPQTQRSTKVNGTTGTYATR